MALIYKICPEAAWRQAEAAGVFTGSPVDLQDGFIHFSTAGQAQETADKHFHGQTDLLVAAVETDGLGEGLRWEPSRGGALFPHLHGKLPLDKVLWVRPLPLRADGRHDFASLLEC
jgi:uncharacterized protein (DUF952 family)